VVKIPSVVGPPGRSRRLLKRSAVDRQAHSALPAWIMDRMARRVESERVGQTEQFRVGDSGIERNCSALCSAPSGELPYFPLNPESCRVPPRPIDHITHG
jgi:hypothetical protein